MSIIKDQYEQISQMKSEILAQIDDIKKEPTVKQYFDLCSVRDNLMTIQKDLYKKMKQEEYSSCHHLWVTTFVDHDYREGRTYGYCGCIKCGLDQSVWHLIDLYGNEEHLTEEQKIMLESIRGTGLAGSNLFCNLDLARAIFSRIKEANPEIDDNTAFKYFEIALDNIRNIKVSNERKVNRAKRLSLNPNFTKWN